MKIEIPCSTLTGFLPFPGGSPCYQFGMSHVLIDTRILFLVFTQRSSMLWALTLYHVTYGNTRTCVMRRISPKLCIASLLPLLTEWLSLCLHLIFPDIVQPEQGENQADSMFVMPVVVTCLHFCSNPRGGGSYLRLE